MKDNNTLAWIGSVITVVTGSLSQDILQVILLVIGILSALFSLFVNIYTWYKRAKADGKIDAKEIKELKDIVEDYKKGDKHE